MPFERGAMYGLSKQATGGLMSLKLKGSKLLSNNILDVQSNLLKPSFLPLSAKGQATGVKGPLNDGSTGLYGLRKSPGVGKSLPPSVGNFNGQVRAN